MNIAELIIRKLEGNLSLKEEALFEEWLNDSAGNKAMFSRLKALKDNGVDLAKFNHLNQGKAWANVKQRAKLDKRRSTTFNRIGYLRYAAILLCLLGLGYGYWTFSGQTQEAIEMDPNAITLQLDNGEVKVLSTDNSSTITDDKGNVLGTRKGSQLDYTKAPIQEELVYNTLTIPHGKRFNILLSDGSNVHLNAGSSIKYPVKFLKGKKRQVFLEGEAFFDVAEDVGSPFIVSSDNMNIRVLGTRFNVASYPEDPIINTVLVEGSVSLYSNHSEFKEANSTLMEPGFKASWKKSDENIQLKKVNTAIYTGWLKGKLVVKKMPFRDIAKKMQRHYNVSITNNYKALDDKVFTATFDIESIEEALNVFAEDTFFEYKKEGNNITIYKSENSNQ